MTNTALELNLPCASYDEFITKPVNLLPASASSIHSALIAYESRQLLQVDQGLQFWCDQPTFSERNWHLWCKNGGHKL
jgi:hypothetical protein